MNVVFLMKLFGIKNDNLISILMKLYLTAAHL